MLGDQHRRKCLDSDDLTREGVGEAIRGGIIARRHRHVFGESSRRERLEALRAIPLRRGDAVLGFERLEQEFRCDISRVRGTRRERDLAGCADTGDGDGVALQIPRSAE